MEAKHLQNFLNNPRSKSEISKWWTASKTMSRNRCEIIHRRKEKVIRPWSIPIQVYKSKKKEQSKLNIQKTRQLHVHELRRHEWQDNMNLYENQRWNQVLRKGKHFLLRMRHPLWCPLCRITEWNVLMPTILWPTDVISHGGHWDTIREWQIMVMTKKTF